MVADEFGLPMNVGEFYEWSSRPEFDHKHVELVRGKPVVMPLPDAPHGRVCAALGYLLHPRNHGGCGYLCLGAGFIAGRNPDSVYAPDVAFYAGSCRYEDVPDRWSDTPPRFIAEVRQVAEELDHLSAKTADYLRIGVAEVWIAEPLVRRITVHRPGQVPVALSGESELRCESVFPQFRCRVRDVFSLPSRRGG